MFINQLNSPTENIQQNLVHLENYLQQQLQKDEYVFLCFDIEVAANLFLVGFGHNDSFWTFGFEERCGYAEISEVRSAINELFHFCKENKIILCGYNIKQYDLIVLAQFSWYFKRCPQLFQLSNNIVQNENNGAYPYLKSTNEFCEGLLFIDLVDSYKEFRGKSSIMSLKKVALLEQFPDVRVEQPWNWDTPAITSEGIAALMDYNHSDIRCVIALAKLTVPSWIKTRKEFLKQFPEMKWHEVLHQTRPHCSESVLQLVTNTTKPAKRGKKALLFKDLCILHKYKWLPDYQAAFGDQNLLGKDKLKLGALSIGNLSFVPGLGGLHSQNKAEYHFTDEDRVLIEIDVSSYYPTLLLLLLKNGFSDLSGVLAPRLEEFIKRRLELKRAGEKSAEQVFKIILNALVGCLNYNKHEYPITTAGCFI
jgi:hypothetical protein